MGKRFIMGACALFLLTALLVQTAFADTLDTSATVPASLTFLAQTTLALEVCNISDDAKVDTITFVYSGTGENDLAPQYVKVNYACNLANYKIAVYTANRAERDPNNANWGALVGSDTSHRLSLMWKAFADTQATPAWTGWSDNSWYYLKDSGDSDYQQSLADDYTRFLFKDSGRTAAELRSGETDANAPAYLYLGMLTGGIQPDVYQATIRFDMLHW